jgi:hypothetical protein
MPLLEAVKSLLTKLMGVSQLWIVAQSTKHN